MNIKEIEPGSIHEYDIATKEIKISKYWTIPSINKSKNLIDYSESLYKNILDSVTERCENRSVCVTLSGGLDSRMVLSSIPNETKCISVTFGESINNEMKTAKKVSKSYSREWFPFVREKNFLDKVITDTIRLIGCENDWIHAHAVGFSNKLKEFKSVIMGGFGFDTFVKGYDVKDIVCIKRLKGLLPDKYINIDYDNVNYNSFWIQIINNECIQNSKTRRLINYKEYLKYEHDSISEIIRSYPHSNDPNSSTITVERRVIPLRVPGLDKRLIEYGYTTPALLKMNGIILSISSKKIYKSGQNVPNANDGVRPGSNHFYRLIQRAYYKIQKYFVNPDVINHSWHDYQKYWDTSTELEKLKIEAGTYLKRLENSIFKTDPSEIILRKNLHWEYGFRLLQLGLWLKIIEEYNEFYSKGSIK